MSKNRNRAKLNKAKTSKEYLSIQYNINYPIYWDECISFNGVGLMGWEIRMYKSWKHTRKKQWKG